MLWSCRASVRRWSWLTRGLMCSWTSLTNCCHDVSWLGPLSFLQAGRVVSKRSDSSVMGLHLCNGVEGGASNQWNIVFWDTFTVLPKLTEKKNNIADSLIWIHHFAIKMLHRIHERTAYLYMEIVIGVYKLTQVSRGESGVFGSLWLTMNSCKDY